MTGIPSLDTYLSTESTESEHRIPSSESPGNAIRIQGPPGSGKTHLLYFLVATCVLPRNYLSSYIGGRNKVAFVVDLDGHFQVMRFHGILVDRLKRSLVEVLSIPVIVERCMKLVHVFRPSSSAHFAATLAHLHSYHIQHFPDQELGMIAIHSIDAFYWPDRFKAEQLQTNLTKTTYSETISSILKDLRISYGLTTVMTLWRHPHQIIQPNRHNHRPDLGHNTDRDSLSLAPDFPEATLVLDSISSEEESSCGIKLLWRGQAHSRPQTCIVSCVIDDKGVVVH